MRILFFDEFVRKLHIVISGGSTTGVFARTMLEAVVGADGREIVDSYALPTFKSFYNGKKSISGIARKLNLYLEPMEFADYVENLPYAAIEGLCNEFRDEIPDIDPDNAGKKLAGLFVAIIREASAVRREPPLRWPSGLPISWGGGNGIGFESTSALRECFRRYFVSDELYRLGRLVEVYFRSLFNLEFPHDIPSYGFLTSNSETCRKSTSSVIQSNFDYTI